MIGRYYYTAYHRDEDGYWVADFGLDAESAFDGASEIYASVADIDWNPIDELPAGILALAVGETHVVIHRV